MAVSITVDEKTESSGIARSKFEETVLHKLDALTQLVLYNRFLLAFQTNYNQDLTDEIVRRSKELSRELHGKTMNMVLRGDPNKEEEAK